MATPEGLSPPLFETHLLSFSLPGLRHAAANLGLAILFFGSVAPGALHYGTGVANLIWAVGAALMGVLSLVRIPPNAAMVNLRSILAVAGMTLVPAQIRPTVASVGIVAGCGVILELFGVVLSQLGRLYLGRSFGLLPANRGVVTAGPFRIIRHPIYLGWFILTVGYVMAYPNVLNALAVIGTLPFMMWRIDLEEKLLCEDPSYRAYTEQVRYRLIPWCF
jgi:protein-S-isoprenylcysteine O-methyltransferase Ste14